MNESVVVEEEDLRCTSQQQQREQEEGDFCFDEFKDLSSINEMPSFDQFANADPSYQLPHYSPLHLLLPLAPPSANSQTNVETFPRGVDWEKKYANNNYSSNFLGSGCGYRTQMQLQQQHMPTRESQLSNLSISKVENCRSHLAYEEECSSDQHHLLVSSSQDKVVEEQQFEVGNLQVSTVQGTRAAVASPASFDRISLQLQLLEQQQAVYRQILTKPISEEFRSSVEISPMQPSFCTGCGVMKRPTKTFSTCFDCCVSLICEDCAGMSHFRHLLIDANDVSSLTQLTSSRLQAKITELACQCNSITQKQQQISEYQEELLSHVNSSVKTIHKQLDNLERRLCDDINKEFTSCIDNFSKQQEKVMEAIDNLTASKQSLHQQREEESARQQPFKNLTPSPSIIQTSLNRLAACASLEPLLSATTDEMEILRASLQHVQETLNSFIDHPLDERLQQQQLVTRIQSVKPPNKSFIPELYRGSQSTKVVVGNNNCQSDQQLSQRGGGGTQQDGRRLGNDDVYFQLPKRTQNSSVGDVVAGGVSPVATCKRGNAYSSSMNFDNNVSSKLSKVGHLRSDSSSLSPSKMMIATRQPGCSGSFHQHQHKHHRSAQGSVNSSLVQLSSPSGQGSGRHNFELIARGGGGVPELQLKNKGIVGGVQGINISALASLMGSSQKKGGCGDLTERSLSSRNYDMHLKKEMLTPPYMTASTTAKATAQALSTLSTAIHSPAESFFGSLNGAVTRSISFLKKDNESTAMTAAGTSAAAAAASVVGKRSTRSSLNSIQMQQLTSSMHQLYIPQQSSSSSAAAAVVVAAAAPVGHGMVSPNKAIDGKKLMLTTAQQFVEARRTRVNSNVVKSLRKSQTNDGSKNQIFGKITKEGGGITFKERGVSENTINGQCMKKLIDNLQSQKNLYDSFKRSFFEVNQG